MADKIAIDTVGYAGIFHLAEHGLHDLSGTRLITTQILFGIVNGIACTQNRMHMRDAFGLFCDDLERHILERDMCGVS